MTVFADTSALYAVLDRDDELHPPAAAWWAGALGGDVRLLTSSYVVVECFALAQRRLGMAAVRALQDELLPAVGIEWVSAEDHRAGVQAVLAADRRDLSLVDCTSFQIMRRLGLRAAFAFDRDFDEQGFGLLPELQA